MMDVSYHPQMLQCLVNLSNTSDIGGFGPCVLGQVNLDAAKQKTVCFNLALQIPWDDLAQARCLTASFEYGNR